MSAVELLYLECERARYEGELITRVSAKDKEYHFQNWVMERLDSCSLDYDEPGRNTYPDFRLVNEPVGFEVKGLAWPGREADYDANSQMPSGRHHGREVYYVFGRYPSSSPSSEEYPVTDLVVCHGSLLNATLDYEHKNRSFRGFGSYGDVLVRDRKMYVVPTPYALLDGTSGVSTLIVPTQMKVSTDALACVGTFERVEADQIVASYRFDLRSNELSTTRVSNPNAGVAHQFSAYRSRSRGLGKEVRLSDTALLNADSLRGNGWQ